MADRGNRPEIWECHLRRWFLNGLRPEIEQAVKTSYIEWKNGRLSAVLTHALHSEELQMAKKERVKVKTDKDLQLAIVQAVSKPGGFSVQRNQQKGGGRGKRQGGRNFEKRGCWICDTDATLQTEARTVDSSGDGKRGSSLRPLKREVNFFFTSHTHTHTYTDLHTAFCNEVKACVSVCSSELNYENSDKSLMMYKSDAFKKMP